MVYTKEEKLEKAQGGRVFTKRLGEIKRALYAIKGQIEAESEGCEFIDYCTEYRFDTILEKDTFNDFFNDEENNYILENDYTDNLRKDIRKAIFLHSNMRVDIFGPPNSSKSEDAMDLGIIIRELQKSIQDIDNNIRFSFDDESFNRKTKIAVTGDVIIRDEAKKSQGIGSHTERDQVQNITKITRSSGIFFIFCSPDPIKNLNATYYFEAAGKKSVHICKECEMEHVNIEMDEYDKCKCEECGNLMDYFEDRVLHKCINRCILYDRNFDPKAVVFFPLHEDHKLRRYYEEEKRKNQEKVRKTTSAAGSGSVENLEHIIRLTDFCEKTLPEGKKLTLAAVKGKLMLFNITLPELAIPTSGEVRDPILQNVIQCLNDEEWKKTILSTIKKLKGEDAEEGIPSELDEVIEEIVDSERLKLYNKRLVPYEDFIHLDIKKFSEYCNVRIEHQYLKVVAEGMVRGDNKKDIERNNKISYDTVTKYYDQLNNKKGTVRICDLLVEYIAIYKLEIPIPEVEQCISRIGSTKADIYWKEEWYSIKYFSYKGKSKKFLQSEDFAPELKRALKDNKWYSFLAYNPFWGMDGRIISIEVDPNGLDEVVIFKPFGKRLIMDEKVFNNYKLI